MTTNTHTILCLDLDTKTGWAICSKGHALKDDNEADALAILYLKEEGDAHV
ncbi:hypothetical protein [Bartonella taylorii]|uniref:hypothetical protein n=1 Tax=Bartonella taylorii TaxID=33046 RepID=UPI001ABBC1AC|nr:hypothetical protein [Bartonella taylorii]